MASGRATGSYGCGAAVDSDEVGASVGDKNGEYGLEVDIGVTPVLPGNAVGGGYDL